MTETRWWSYLRGLMGDQSQQEAAEKIGISKSNITRWKAGARADPDFVLKVARAYGANVLEALVEAEFLTEDEASLTEISPSLDLGSVSAIDLVTELQERVDRLNYLFSLTEGNTSHVSLDTVVSDLGAHRAKKSHDRVPPRPADEDNDTPLGAVAYSGEDEDAQRQKEDSDFD